MADILVWRLMEVYWYILLFTQAPIRVRSDGTTIRYYPLDSVWKLCMGINISVQYNGGFLPDYIFDPRLLPVGNPFKYHVVALYL